MPVGSKPIRTGNARPCRNSAKARNSSAVFCTRNFFRLFHPGASMRASWRSLATSIATQTTASGILCGLVMVGPSPLVNTEHTHSTGYLRLTMTSMASGRLAPFSHAGPPHSLAKTSSFPRCYGSEFINWHLKAWCESKHIQLTRGRPYKKDDNAHVEQKNWTHVRKLLGWDRYDSPEAVEMINDLYRNELRLWLNLYLPSVKLVKKTQEDEYLPIYGGEAVHGDHGVVGRVRSCAYGFTAKKNLAYSYLPIEMGPGAQVQVELFGSLVPASVTTDAVISRQGARQ